MEYNINSFSFKYNRFANFSNPYFNNIVPNSMNQTTNQCFQCTDQPFIRTIIASNANSCQMPTPYTPRKCILQKQSITASTPQTSSSGKLSSTFTIDSILETNKNSDNDANPSMRSSQSNIAYLDLNEEVLENSKESTIYNWLNCSRYKPPKVNKRSHCSTDKRKAINRGPRIPFTSFQISELENKFRDTHYLSSLEVNHLAHKLNLTDSRIRIWFQNRRARDKREKRSEEMSQKSGEATEEPIESCGETADGGPDSVPIITAHHI